MNTQTKTACANAISSSTEAINYLAAALGTDSPESAQSAALLLAEALHSLCEAVQVRDGEGLCQALRAYLFCEAA